MTILTKLFIMAGLISNVYLASGNTYAQHSNTTNLIDSKILCESPESFLLLSDYIKHNGTVVASRYVKNAVVTRKDLVINDVTYILEYDAPSSLYESGGIIISSALSKLDSSTHITKENKLGRDAVVSAFILETTVQQWQHDWCTVLENTVGLQAVESLYLDNQEPDASM